MALRLSHFPTAAVDLVLHNQQGFFFSDRGIPSINCGSVGSVTEEVRGTSSRNHTLAVLQKLLVGGMVAQGWYSHGCLFNLPSHSQGAVFELHKSGWRCSHCRKWLITRKTKGSIHQITQQEGGMTIGSHAES